jgi:two-component system sensor histidine kinase DesK
MGMRGAGPTRGRIFGAIWSGVWLWPLLNPLRATFDGDVHPAGPALAGLVAFVALYIWLIVGAFDRDGGSASRLELSLLGLVTVIGLGLALSYTRQGNGSYLFTLLYVGVCGAAVLDMPIVAVWVLGDVVAMGTIGIAAGATFGDMAEGLWSTTLACALVYVVRQVVSYARQLQAARAELAEAAVAEERLRFGRDLHELLGHTLTLVVVKAQVVRRLVDRDPTAAAAAAVDIEEIGRQALAEVREAVTGYRQRPFAAELDGARAALSDAGIQVSIRQVGTQLPPPADVLFGWAVREGATNVIRHSGARNCEITVRRTDGESSVEIRDDGSGSAAGVPGNGLRGLRERLATAGGELTAGPNDDGGWTLRAGLAP